MGHSGSGEGVTPATAISTGRSTNEEVGEFRQWLDQVRPSRRANRPGAYDAERLDGVNV